MRNIKDYSVSYYSTDPIQRHICKNSKSKEFYLCGNMRQNKDFRYICSLERYINNKDGLEFIPVCKQCIAKLSTKIRKQVVYNLIVTKLKS